MCVVSFSIFSFDMHLCVLYIYVSLFLISWQHLRKIHYYHITNKDIETKKVGDHFYDALPISGEARIHT